MGLPKQAGWANINAYTMLMEAPMVTKARPDEPPWSLCSLPTAVSCVWGDGRVRGLLVFPRMPNVQTFGVRAKTAWCATTLIVPEQRPKSTSDQHPGRPSYCTSCIPPCLPPRLGGQAHGADDSTSLASTPPLRLPGFFSHYHCYVCATVIKDSSGARPCQPDADVQHALDHFSHPLRITRR